MDEFSSTYQWFNRLEAVIWFSIAIALPFFIKSSTPRQHLAIRFASLGFILFGISDLIEANSLGKTPLWLWTYKISCAAFILACRYIHIGWNRCRLNDRYLLFGLLCLAASIAAIYFQFFLYKT